MELLFLFFAQCCTIAWSLYFNTSYRLRGFVVVNLLLVIFLGSKVIHIAGVVSSIGSLFFSTVFVIQTMIYMKE